MRRIEGSPVGRISESMQKRGGRVKGIPTLQPQNVELVRDAREKGLIDELPASLQEVLSLRYPAEGEPKTLVDIGADMRGITKQGVRKKEARALRRIRRLQEGKRQTDMGRPRDDIDVEEIVRLYTEEKTSAREIAKSLGVSGDTIIRRLKSAEIKIRISRSRKK